MQLGGEGELRRTLALQHVAVELGRPAHGLAGVVDDVVESLVGREQVVAELLDARRVAQIEPVDLEPFLPVGEVGLQRVTGGGVAREPRRHDQVGACSEQLDPGLVADLDAAARQYRDATLEIRRLRPLREVERRARRAELVVEGVELAVGLLADVAVLFLVRLPRRLGVALGFVAVVRLEALRWVHVRRREHRPLAEHSDARVGEQRLVGADARVPLLLALGLREPAPLNDIGVEDIRGCREQARALVDRQAAEQTAVVGHRLEQLGCLAQLCGDLVARVPCVGVFGS